MEEQLQLRQVWHHHKQKVIFAQKRPQTYKSYIFILYISSMYYISFMYFGYIMMYFNSIDFSHIIKVFDIQMPKDTAQGVYSGLPALGACLGSFISKYFIQKFSRKQNFVIANSVGIFAGFFVLIPNMTTLLIGRLIQGACVGFFCSITPLTVKELSPIQLAGTMNGVNNIAISLGYFFGYFFGWLSTAVFGQSTYNYILVFGASILICLVQLIWIVKFFPYQTPKYYLKHNKIAEAKDILQKIYLLQYQDRILQEKILQVEFANTSQKTINQSDLLSQPNLQSKVQKKATKLASFSSSFLVIAQQMTGFNVFLLYGSQIAKQYLPNMAISLSMIISLQKLIVTTIASFFLFNYMGRKRLLIFGSILCTLALFSVVFGGQKINFNEENGEIYIFLGIFVSIFSVAATQGPLTWVYVSQVLQPESIALVVFMKWMSNFVSVATFPILRSWSGNNSCVQIFMGYFIFTLIATIIFQFILVETKDRNEVQIYGELYKRQQSIQRFLCKCMCFRNRQS